MRKKPKSRQTSRLRDNILIAESINVPLEHVDENGNLRNFDSIRHHIAHNGWTKGHVKPLSPFSNFGAINADSKNKATHRIEIFKTFLPSITDSVLWMDGLYPRHLSIIAIQDHETNRRKLYLMCKELKSGLNVINGDESSYGNEVEKENMSILY